MAKYCVMNLKKHKKSSIKNLQKEANREWENEEKYKNNVDLDFKNVYLKKSENWEKDVEEILEKNDIKNLRSDSIYMTTSIYAFSPEWEEELLEKYPEEEVEKEKLEYFQKCFEFEQTRGEVINFVIHTDEDGSWHAHAATVPITETPVTTSVMELDEQGEPVRYKTGKSKDKIKYKQEPVLNDDGTPKMRKALSAKAIFGNRAKMSKDQTAFYEYCGKPFGMERGECRIQDAPGAKKHLDETEYKAQQEKQAALDISERLKAQGQKALDDAREEAENIKKFYKEDALKQAKEKFKAKYKALEDDIKERDTNSTNLYNNVLKMNSEASELLKTIKDQKENSENPEVINFIDYYVNNSKFVKKETMLKMYDDFKNAPKVTLNGIKQQRLSKEELSEKLKRINSQAETYSKQITSNNDLDFGR